MLTGPCRRPMPNPMLPRELSMTRTNVVRTQNFRNEPLREDEKLEALVHYIIYRCNDPRKLGATKLNKILWYSDITNFLYTGKSISDAKYVKLQHGPVPANLVKVREKLVEEGAIAIRQDIHFGYPQTQAFALTPPNLDYFTATEISRVDEIMTDICENHSAASISAVSHDMIWEAAEIGEEIPLYAVFAAQQADVTQEDIDWALHQAKRKGLSNL
jgi:hypothetical protein